jgi:LCP family protein required for cell wall assembly
MDGVSPRRPPGSNTSNHPSQQPASASEEAAAEAHGEHRGHTRDEAIAETDLHLTGETSNKHGNRKSGKGHPRSLRFLTWRKVMLAAGLLIFALLAAGALAFWHVQSNLIVNNLDGGAALLQEDTDPSMLDGEGDGRINALLIGIDEKSGLADSIILASFDPIAKDVVLLSIPRDLYLETENFGPEKINAAHAYGQRYGYQGGGPELLKDTVSAVTGVPIHYYGRVDFSGFKQAVNIIDGITVNVEQPIHDPYYPDQTRTGYEPLHLEAGKQHMDGKQALRYVRSRKTTSDFDRSRRQQKILMALREKVLSRGTLANPNKVTGLLQTLSGNAETNMSVDEIMRLRELSQDVTRDDIKRVQLDTSQNNYLSFSNVHGQSVLVPSAGDFSEIQAYVRTLMVDSYIKSEAAKVSVLNGTTQAGLARETADLLRSYGYDVVNVDNASNQKYTQTVIFNHAGDENPYTLRYLEKRFGAAAKRRQLTEQNSAYDIEIVLGRDYEPDAE